MGRIGRSWSLVKQSFQILRGDKELMLLPVFSAISCVLVTAVLLVGGGLLFAPAIKASSAAGLPAPLVFVGLFAFYVANYFVIIFFNTALVGAASIRLSGGNATLKDGLRLATKRLNVILQWAVLAATVGIVLRVIEGRVKLAGRIVAGLLGAAWSLASYFVVPVLAFENLGPIDALKRSAGLISKTCGEEVVGGFSIGVIFFLLSLPGIALPVVGGLLFGQVGASVGVALMVLYGLLLAIVGAATQGIFMTALYRYACTGEAVPGFQKENFSMAWHPR